MFGLKFLKDIDFQINETSTMCENEEFEIRFCHVNITAGKYFSVFLQN